MLVELADVGLKKKSFAFELRPDEIEIDGLRETVDFRGEWELIDGKAHIRGQVLASVGLECTRCLDPVVKDIDESFEAVFVKLGSGGEVSELALDPEELDESVIEGDAIDLNEVAREQILLALPVQVFCRDDCKGLCPKCGENQNLIDCNCEEDQTDPRWAVLKNLR